MRSATSLNVDSRRRLKRLKCADIVEEVRGNQSFPALGRGTRLKGGRFWRLVQAAAMRRPRLRVTLSVLQNGNEERSILEMTAGMIVSPKDLQDRAED